MNNIDGWLNFFNLWYVVYLAKCGWILLWMISTFIASQIWKEKTLLKWSPKKLMHNLNIILHLHQQQRCTILNMHVGSSKYVGTIWCEKQTKWWQHSLSQLAHHYVNSLLKYSCYPFENEYNNGLFSSWVEAWNQLCGSLKVDGYHQSLRTNFTHYFIVC